MLRKNHRFRHFLRAYSRTRLEISSGRKILNNQTGLGRTVNGSIGGSIGFGFVLLAATLCFGSTEYVFNTNDGTMTLDGNLVTEVHGTPFVSSVIGGAQQFRFLGDLTFVDNDRIFVTGSRPLSLFAGNDVDISPLASFQFDAAG